MSRRTSSFFIQNLLGVLSANLDLPNVKTAPNETFLIDTKSFQRKLKLKVEKLVLARHLIHSPALKSMEHSYLWEKFTQFVPQGKSMNGGQI